MSAGVDISDELRDLGRRRHEKRAEDKALVTEIRGAVARARRSGLAMADIADLLDIDRTQLYRTYTPRAHA